MSLSHTLKPLFNSGDRNRGASYFHGGSVSNMKVRDGILTAEVDGSYGFYEVTLDVEDFENEEAISCTCPRFDDGYFCKHIWATILKFEAIHGMTEADSRSISETRSGLRKKKPLKKNHSGRSSVPQWMSLLQSVTLSSTRASDRPESPFQTATAQKAEIHYVIDTSVSPYRELPELSLRVFRRERKVNGEWGKLKAFNFSHSSAIELADPVDRQIAGLLMGADRSYADQYSYRGARSSFSEFEIEPNWSGELCELLAASGRLRWTLGMDLPLEEFHSIRKIDFLDAAEIQVHIREQTKPKQSAILESIIEHNGEQLDDAEVVMLSKNGIALLMDRLIRVSNPAAIPIWTEIKNSPSVNIAKKDRNAFLNQIARIDGLPAIRIPDSWKVEQPEVAEPQGVLKLDNSGSSNELGGEVHFGYGETIISLKDSRTAIYDEENNCWSVRNPAAESELVQQLTAFPLTDTTQHYYENSDFRVNKKHLMPIIDQLAENGWAIQLHGKPIKRAGEFSMSVESGQDWFDLAATVNFEGQSIALPGLLQAMANKQHFVTLADGTKGRIPSELLEKYSRLAAFGQVVDDKVRFRPTQAMLLDAMLDAKGVKVDKGFRAFRKKLKSFNGVKPKSPPRGFKGELRSYQREGLGWLHFLREFGLGGCLADDMGLGKTVQVLSLLESRRTRKINADESKGRKKKAASKKKKQPALLTAAEQLKRKPSIVIVPKSLIFNWIEEAAKFTPRLRMLNYTGTKRMENVRVAMDEGGFDVLITTYGTMRRDIEDLAELDLDYAILDESQAIKNSKAQCAKSSRLLRADYRLAMTGTPIENHLGELWSLFEFLNPGMLGNSTNFARLTNQKKNNEAEREETLASLSKAISPFLLRRTKEQVLTDLPPKTEQTLCCDMLPAQKKAYNELKEYYRVKLAKKVETDGIGRSKIQVLEALLRLRQVACDPRLLDKKSKPGAKLELLGQQICDIASEGHKVLVFSQFTSFLSLVKQQFDEIGIKYEYLDGQSTKRAQSVKRFQEDNSVSAFLISIKAGGHGLNLTAADYVFILDPWWNPAVEAQAIDRAHRMGQKNPVIAYRMICRDTVEEKIVALQESKRDLADKIIQPDESLIRSLTAEDLQVLFS